MSVLDASFSSICLGFIDLSLQYFFSRKSSDTLKKKNWTQWLLFLVLWAVYVIAQYWADYYVPVHYYIFIIVSFVLLILQARIVAERDIKTSLYYSAVYFVTADCVQILLVRFLFFYFGQDFIVFGPFSARLLWNVVCALLKIVTISFVSRFIERDAQITGSLSYMILCLLPILPYCYIRNITTWFPGISMLEAPSSISVAIFLNAACALIILVGNERIVASRRKQQEQKLIKTILCGQNEQYKARMQSTEKVNKIYHNLKHILRGIDALSTEKRVHDFIKDTYAEIDDYELFRNSGHPVVDWLISEAMHRCQEADIIFVPYVDGRDWNMLEPIDITVLFGNALDNAIESSMLVQDPKKRVIHVNAHRSECFLLMHLHNFYVHQIRQKNGKFITTKDKGDGHGYGLDSIRNVVEKYNGELDIGLADDEFTLSILIPWTGNESIL